MASETENTEQPVRFYPTFNEQFQRWLVCDRNAVGDFGSFSTTIELTESQAQRICDIMNEEQ